MSIFASLLGGLFGGVQEPSWEEQTDMARQAWQDYGGEYRAARESLDRDLAAERARYGESDRYKAYEQSRTEAYEDAIAEINRGEAGKYLQYYHDAEYQSRVSRWQSDYSDRMRKAGWEWETGQMVSPLNEPDQYLSDMNQFLQGYEGPGAENTRQQFMNIAQEQIDQTPVQESDMATFYTGLFGEPQQRQQEQEDPGMQRAQQAASGRRIGGLRRYEQSPWI